MNYPTIEDAIGRTPLVALQRIGVAEAGLRGNVVLGKLEGNNPAGSVKDRPALSMIRRAQERGKIKPGDTLIEATSGNTGIALAMAAAIKGYRMVLIMPEDLSIERVQTMKAFGAELILTPKSGGMEYARDLAGQMQQAGKGVVLDQFANEDNPRIHYETTGPEIWADTQGRVTHFVSAMGTTGTITGVSRYLKEQNPHIQVIGAQPSRVHAFPASASGPRSTCPRSTTQPRRASWSCTLASVAVKVGHALALLLDHRRRRLGHKGFVGQLAVGLGDLALPARGFLAQAGFLGGHVDLPCAGTGGPRPPRPPGRPARRRPRRPRRQTPSLR
jgi:cysteine synthase B